MNAEVSDRKVMDLLDILLAARFEDGSGMSDEEIRNEVDVIRVAGWFSPSINPSMYWME